VAVLGWDQLIKPWFDVWLPDATAEQYIGAVIPTLTPLLHAADARPQPPALRAARAAGGTRYPIGSIPFTRSDWVRQYGDAWATLTSLKRRCDPDGILTPGRGILP